MNRHHSTSPGHRLKPDTGGMSRRAILKSSGALLVSFALDPVDALGQAVATLVGNPPRALDG